MSFQEKLDFVSNSEKKLLNDVESNSLSYNFSKNENMNDFVKFCQSIIFSNENEEKFDLLSVKCEENLFLLTALSFIYINNDNVPEYFHKIFHKVNKLYNISKLADATELTFD